MKKISLISLFILFANVLFAEVNFDTENVLTYAVNQPASVVARDFDKDGDIDLIVASMGDDTYTIFENIGQNIFKGHPINIGLDARDVECGDLDGDGDIDFVGACWTDNTLVIFENKGNFQFVKKILSTNASSVRTCKIADVDKDGFLDIISGAGGESTGLTVYYNKGGLNFQSQNINSSTEGFRFLDVGDVDNDGDMDIVGATWFSGGVSLFVNQGSGSFIEKVLSTGSQCICARFFDIDNDGKLDIPYCYYGASKVGWLKNNGGNNFTDISIGSAPGPYTVAPVDYDKDGDIDIFCTYYNGGEVVIYENDGSNKFNMKSINKNLLTCVDIIECDINQDGLMDAVSTTVGDNKVILHLQKANKEFSNLLINTKLYSTIDLVTGDFDKDGDVDVIGASYYSENIVLYENVYPKKYSPRVLIEGLVGLRKLNSVDFNNDGLFDLVSVSWWDNKVALHINQGNMKFQTYLLDAFSRVNEMNETKRRPCWCETVDLDKDGKLDIVVAYFGSDEVIWYKNMGGYNFKTIVITKNTKGIECVNVKDVDKDGDLDLVTASWDDDKVSWFENTGGNNYVEHIISTDVDYASSAFCEDMDLDGDIDILATAFNGDQLYWFENDGKQNFYRHLISDQVDGARTVIAANLDNQGMPEVVCASWWGCDVKWFNNDGGSFSSGLVKNKLMRTGALQVADMDLDGDLDIVTASASENKIAWYENRFVQIVPPVLLFPIENALGIVQNTDLIWDKALYTVKYQIQLATDYEFTNIIVDTVQTFTSIRLSDDLCNSNRVYYWRVKSYGQVDKSGWSEIRTFETGKQFSDISGLTTPSDALINVNPSILVQSVRINAYMPKSDIAEIILVEISGKEVKEIYKGYMNKGENVFTLEKRDIVPGMYYLLLKTTDAQKAIKVIVQ